MKSYQIYLIRHSMTTETSSGAYIGRTDVSLSFKGIQYINNTLNEYTYPKIDALYSSPLSRCIQTCNIIYPDMTPIKLDGLSECDFGDWEGKTAIDLADNPDFTMWLSDSNKYSPPNGESGSDFARRICKTFERLVVDIMKTGTTRVGIVTHGGIIMTLLAIYGLPQAPSYQWRMDSCFGYAMRITPSLWLRDKVAEVYEKVPYAKLKEPNKK